MYTNPSSARVLEAVREALLKEIVPEVQTDKARVTLQMIDQMLLSVERRIPVEQQWMAEECGRMAALMAETSAALAGVPGESAGNIRSAASEAAAVPCPVPGPPFGELSAAYLALSTAITGTIGDLNDLMGLGVEDAPRLLTGVRAYIQLRIERDMAGIFAMEGGMAGRG